MHALDGFARELETKTEHDRLRSSIIRSWRVRTRGNHLILQAVSDAQRVLEEYLRPQPRTNERVILDQLVEILERPDLIVAVSQMRRNY